MTPHIDIPFALGQVVWRASATPVERWVECPECAGTKAITMILGNGEEYSLECALCGPGYSQSSGLVRVYDYETTPEEFTCTDLEVRDKEVRYGCTKVEFLYEDKEACRTHCDELNEEHKRHAEKRDIAVLSSRREGLAFSAHYWSSVVRKLKKELATAEARLNVSKDKKKASNAE